jgi:hypothetical protein
MISTQKDMTFSETIAVSPESPLDSPRDAELSKTPKITPRLIVADRHPLR